MALGKCKYLNPSGVLESVVDDQGDRLTIGEEKDISGYNGTLLQRIQDAFDYQSSKKKMAKKAQEDVPMRAHGDNEEPG